MKMIKEIYKTLQQNNFSPVAFKDLERKFNITSDEISLVYMIYVNTVKMQKDKIIYKKAIDIVKKMETKDKSIMQTYMDIVDLYNKYCIRRNYVESSRS